MGPEEFTASFRTATRSFDHASAVELTEALIAHSRQRDDAFPLGPAKSILSLLRKPRWFTLMRRCADALIAGGQDDPNVVRQYAQALIDLGAIAAALAVLEELVDTTSADGSNPNPGEHAEAQGLMGRALKQLYIDADRPTLSRHRHTIQRAIDCYAEVYDADDSQLWHGINAVALAERGLADGVEFDGSRSDVVVMAQARAQKILHAVEARRDHSEVQAWDLATGLEAIVALETQCGGRSGSRASPKPSDRLPQVVPGCTNADAFEYASTRRQLIEVWGLTPDGEMGRRILPALGARLLRSDGGSLSGTAQSLKQLASSGLERVFGDVRSVRVEWLHQKGSSGSPVFDQDWGLIALHHWGHDQTRRLNGNEGFYEANEGILIEAIQAATREATR